jgi:hypothetical protein
MKSIWRGTWVFGLALALVLGVAVTVAQNGETAYKPKRINRAVELLAEGQPIYYTGSHTGAPGGLGDAAASFDQGKKDAQTFADYISYDMEHTAYDIVGLTAYMKGLVAGGPTKSGHRTPAVIVNVPVNGLDEVTDPWPLNPDGELLLGVKEEDKYALANVSENLKVPGIGMAEWGPGDMALSLGVPSGRGSVNDPRMQAARSKVLAACKANHVAFLNSLAAADVVDMIKEGVMVGPASQQTAEIGRKFTKRKMPW